MKIGIYSLTSRLQTNAPIALSSKLTPNVHIVIALIRIIKSDIIRLISWFVNLLQANESITNEKSNEAKAINYRTRRKMKGVN